MTTLGQQLFGSYFSYRKVNTDEKREEEVKKIQNIQEVERRTPYIPPEIIKMILNCLKDDKKTLAACSLVNRTFYLHTIPILYNTISFTFPFTFTSFANVTHYHRTTECFSFIRHLDFSSFSTCGLQKSSATIQNVVTPDILINILLSCQELETFSISETLESTITFDVLKTLFINCKNLKTLDFCGCSSKQFVISEINTIIPILSHTPNLTHLDFGGCSISDITLNFLSTETNIPKTLKHLLLANCKNISSESIAKFASQCHKLETLNLYSKRNISSTINEYDLITILSSPCAKKLQNLDIGASQVTPRVLLAIQQNCSSLVNLGIAKAPIQSLNHITEFLTNMTNLQYIDLTSIPCFNVLNIYSLINSLNKNQQNQIHTIELNESLLKKLTNINDCWRKIEENYTRRLYYSRMTQKQRPDLVHPRKLDIADCGPERISKIFQYYSYGV
ncbi:3561_t:CDS:2 [Diversispora eburnea]|uniref:3561_t:CDS:1 n=1 Tax=Diversispora eburnea TaxID=1213867 RepID=A0A9N9AA30_9GLOM|nr:3561_t:CDS:2 [Diversispora eburnea]